MIDVRLRGFTDRAPLADAWGWLDAVPWQATERISRDDAPGRVLAEAITATADLPDRDRALWNGFAVVAAETEGAGAYNPVAPPSPIRPIVAGALMPGQTDAVLTFDAVDDNGCVVAETARGEGVARCSDHLRVGAEALPAGRRLRAPDTALLALLGIETIAVRRRPVVRVVVAGPKAGADAIAPLLATLLSQDGAIASFVPAPSPQAMITALSDGRADLLIVAGRSGTGVDDGATRILAEADGRLACHGIAIRPGGSSGLGWRGPTPVLLLPGDPLACFAAYALLAGRLVRRMGGRRDAPPMIATLQGKIVSGVGYADFARVRLNGDSAEPLGAVETGGLAGAARADGYVLVPEASEGYPAESRVPVHLFAESP